MQTPPESSNVKPSAVPLACNLNAIDDQQRPRHEQLVQRLLLAPDRDCHELPNGYAFRFARDAQIISELAEFITYESLCCPFFTFTLEVEADGGSVWLRLTGSAAVKELLKAEFIRG